MAKQIGEKTFNPNTRQYKVTIEDDYGVRRPLHVSIGLQRCNCCGHPFAKLADQGGPIDVDAMIAAHIDSLELEHDEKHIPAHEKAGDHGLCAQMKARRRHHKGECQNPIKEEKDVTECNHCKGGE